MLNSFPALLSILVKALDLGFGFGLFVLLDLALSSGSNEAGASMD